MVTLKFADTHNMVAFLSKPIECDGFEQIVDFLNAHPIRYALTVNPTIYISCIKQFWSTVKAKTINGEAQLHARVDGKKIIITESSVRRDLRLADEEGVDCLPNSTIFEQLALMGSLGTTSGGGPRCQETMKDTIDQTRVLDLEKTKTTQHNEIASLKRRVKKLEKKNRSRTQKLKRLYKVGLTARVESSDNGETLGEDASKQGRIDVINADEKITLNMEGYKLKDLKLKEFDSIQEMFDKAFKRQKVEDDIEKAELKQLMKIIPDEEEVAIDAIPLVVKSPSIVDWKIYKEGRKRYYQIMRADGKSQMYMFFSQMLKNFDREDLYKLLKAKYE
ncbi:hypothetical protein Tco_0692579 [Tanacetum coccineum]